MQLVLTDEQDMLASVARRAARDGDPIATVRRAHATGGTAYDHASWQRACTQLGVGGVAAPRSAGGGGAGLTEAAVVATEFAAELSGAPLLSTLLAVDLLSSDRSAAEHIPSLLNGTRHAGVVLGDPIDLRPTTPGTSGEPAYVLDGTGASRLVALTETGLLVVDLEREGPGIVSEPVVGLDPTRAITRVRMVDHECEFHPLHPTRIDSLIDRRSVLLAADALGVLRAMVRITTEYATARTAFGRTIGSFQGVKHQLAELFCAQERATAVVLGAAAEIDECGPDAHRLALVAERSVPPEAVRVTTECLRLLGGIGYTWEHDAHLYVRRARADLALARTPGRLTTALFDSLFPDL